MAGLIFVRARFTAANADKHRLKGFYNNIFYDIKIKQDGEKIRIIRADDLEKISVTEYMNLEEFTDNWQIQYKYIK